MLSEKQFRKKYKEGNRLKMLLYTSKKQDSCLLEESFISGPGKRISYNLATK